MSRVTKIISFIGLITAMFMGALDSTIVNITLSKVMTHFNASLADANWVTTIYTLALAVFTITSPKTAGRYDRKEIMLLGLALFSGFSAACMLATSLPELIAFRLFQGLGGTVITPIILPVGIEILGKTYMSKIANVVGAVATLTVAGGPPISGMIIKYASRRQVFGVNVPLTIVAFLIIAMGMREPYDESLVRKTDLPGTILLTLGLGGLTFGLLGGRQYDWQSGIILGTLVGGVLAIGLFIFIGSKVGHPPLELDLFREETLTTLSLVYFLTGFVLVGPTLILNYFLQDVLNNTALYAALIIVPVSLTIMVAMPLGTKLFGQVGVVPVALVGLLVMTASSLLLSFITTTTPKVVIITFLVIDGASFGLSSVSLVASVKHLPKNKGGIDSGIVNATCQIGTYLGIVILVAALDNNVNTAKQRIRQDAIQIADRQQLSPKVDKMAHQQLNSLSSTTESTRLATKNKQTNLRRALKQAVQFQVDLPEPRKGTDLYQVYQAQKKLALTTDNLKMGNQRLALTLTELENQSAAISKLSVASQKINLGNQKISQGQKKLLVGLKQLAQKKALMTALRKIKHIENRQISQAFSHTYLVGVAIVLILSPIVLLMDRKPLKG